MKETCGMTQNKMVHPLAGRDQGKETRNWKKREKIRRGEKDEEIGGGGGGGGEGGGGGREEEEIGGREE
jgi:hypothetical protein